MRFVFLVCIFVVKVACSAEGFILDTFEQPNDDKFNDGSSIKRSTTLPVDGKFEIIEDRLFFDGPGVEKEFSNAARLYYSFEKPISLESCSLQFVFGERVPEGMPYSVGLMQKETMYYNMSNLSFNKNSEQGLSLNNKYFNLEDYSYIEGIEIAFNLNLNEPYLKDSYTMDLNTLFVTPEPCSMLILGCGLFGLVRRRRMSKTF